MMPNLENSLLKDLSIQIRSAVARLSNASSSVKTKSTTNIDMSKLNTDILAGDSRVNVEFVEL